MIKIDVVSPVGLGLPVAALLLFNGWFYKHLRGELKSEHFSDGAFGFCGLSLVLLGLVMWRAVPADWQPAAFGLSALCSLGALWLRLPEVTLPAQGLLVVGVGAFVARFAEQLPAPWWSPLPLFVAALALMHWWQHSRKIVLASEARLALEFGGALAVVATGVCWLHGFFPGDAWMLATSAAALVALVYGLATDALSLIVAGQVFTLVSLAAFFSGITFGDPRWAIALAPFANLALTGFIVEKFAGARLALRAKSIGLCYRLAASAVLSVWAMKNVQAEWRASFFAGAGALQLLWGTLTRHRERAGLGSLYAMAGMAVFLLRLATPGWPELAALIAIPASLHIGKLFAAEPIVAEETRSVLVIAAAASCWLWVTRWTTAHGWGDQLTIAWILLALLMFAAGLSLRERIYRVGGFAILSLAVGRLFLVDVWGFDTLYRIVSFLALGAAMLGLSFVYHRFSDAIRRWL